ncbi:MAG: HEPN domain-containing protein [Thermodesulfobacteriota bacterium]
MVNIEKHISYWRSGAQEDWEVANQLISSGRIRHELFFLHLAFEKVLKAHICRSTNDIAPRLHNLVRLAELADISLDQRQTNCLAEMSPLNIESRYPGELFTTPTREEANSLQERAKELFEWLMNRL